MDHHSIHEQVVMTLPY